MTHSCMGEWYCPGGVHGISCPAATDEEVAAAYRAAEKAFRAFVRPSENEMEQG